MRKSLVIIGLIISFGLGGMIEAAHGQQSAPETAVDTALTKLKTGDWAGFVRYVHPSALQEFKFYVIKITQIRLQSGATDARFETIFGRPTLEEVQNAPAEILLTNFLRGATLAVPEFRGILARTQWQRLGVVNEGTDFKHVVVRQTYAMGDNIVRRVEVLTLEKDGEQWKLQLPPSIETFLDELGWPKLD